MMRLPLVLAAFAVVSLNAAEYKIQMHRPLKAGDKFHLTADMSQVNRIENKLGAQSSPLTRQEISLDLAGSVHVVAVDAVGKPAKVEFTVEKCEVSRGKESSPAFPKGTVLTAQSSEGQKEVKSNGPSVPSDLKEPLFILLGVGKTERTDDEVFGSKEPRSPGDSWDIQAEHFGELIDEKKALGIAPENIQGKVYFEQVTKIDGVECVELSSKVFVKNIKLPIPPQARVKRSHVSLRFNGKYPVDASIPCLADAMEMNMDLEAEQKLGNTALSTKVNTLLKTNRQMRYATRP